MRDSEGAEATSIKFVTSPGPYTAPPPSLNVRRRSIAPWWVSLIILGAGALIAAMWVLFGGLPFTNHVAYGSVPVPGAGVVTLPAGTVYISFEEDGIFGEDDSADMPSDLEVLIDATPGLATQPALHVERLSDSLFAMNVNSTGHVPYGRILVATPGSYDVTTSAIEQTSAVSPRVTFGEPPWNPFGPLIVGALIIFTPFVLLALALILPIRRA